MLRILSFLLNNGVSTVKDPPLFLDAGVRGLPKLGAAPLNYLDAQACVNVCPTDAISLTGKESQDTQATIKIDLGSCIACGLCISQSPTGAIENDLRTNVSAIRREDLFITNSNTPQNNLPFGPGMFNRSIAARVVSTGCSACDLEIGAAGNAIFDMERFGIQVVASPRFADVLLITGPVPKAMHEPLRRCYEAMAEPRLVVAVGTCAISGGVHKGGYAEANGASAIIPVDVFIPGCPPHPWSIINGIRTAMQLKR